MADCLLAGGGGYDNLDAITADASHVLPTATFVNSSGDLVPGTMTTKGSATYNPSTSSQSIASGRYLTANQTIKAVGTTNMAAAYIKSGVTVRVGCAENANSVVSITGSYTSAASSVAVTSAQMVQGSSAYVNGVKVDGGIATMAGTTYTPGATSQTMIPANRYLTGTSTIAAIGGNATAGLVRSGYTFSSKSAGVNVSGTMKDYAATTITPSNNEQVFATGGKYVTGNLTVNGVSMTNFVQANIKKGVKITICGKEVTGNFEGYVS